MIKAGIDLKKINDTCKLIGMEQYSPAAFLEVMYRIYTDLDSALHDGTISMSSRHYLPLLIAQGDLGNLLMRLNEETGRQLVGEQLDAGNATTL